MTWMIAYVWMGVSLLVGALNAREKDERPEEDDFHQLLVEALFKSIELTTLFALAVSLTVIVLAWPLLLVVLLAPTRRKDGYDDDAPLDG